MVGKAAKNVSPSPTGDIDVLLDVLGNETRRRILGLISHEPMYFNQLASQIGIGQQAILRHVKILEDSGLIKSYSQKSDFGAPDRKYYKLNSSLNISISMSNDNFTVRSENIEELRHKEAHSLYKRFDELDTIIVHHSDNDDHLNVSAKKKAQYAQRRSTMSVGQILSELQQNLDETEDQVLYLESRLNDLRALKQRIIKKIHDIEKDNFDDVQRRLMCLIMEGPAYRKEEYQQKLTIPELAEILDKNERAVENVLAGITRKLEIGSSIYELFKNLG